MAKPPVLPPDVMAALAKGRKIEAIKLLRKSSGLGLAETKAVVDAFLRSQGGAAPAHTSHTFSTPDAKPESDKREYGPAQTDTPVAPLAPRPGNMAPGEVANSNSGFWWVLFLLAVAGVGYYVLER